MEVRKELLFKSLAPEVKLNHGANVRGRLKVNLRLSVQPQSKTGQKEIPCNDHYILITNYQYNCT